MPSKGHMIERGADLLYHVVLHASHHLGKGLLQWFLRAFLVDLVDKTTCCVIKKKRSSTQVIDIYG